MSFVTGFEHEIRQLTTLITRCVEMKTLRLMFRLQKPNHHLSHARRLFFEDANQAALRRVLLPLVRTAIKMNICIGAEECKYGWWYSEKDERMQRIYEAGYPEPLVSWMYSITPVRLHHYFQTPFFQNRLPIVKKELVWNAKKQNWKQRIYSRDYSTIRAEDASRERQLRLSAVDCEKEYQLIPECRCCLKFFPTDEDLRRHLTETPTHR